MESASRWHSVQPSAFPHEQKALDLLRERLPATPPFRAWSNFEFIAEDGSINEVDALVVSTDRIYLIEIKNWAGHISGTQNSWAIRAPNGHERYAENPLLLANRKARKLKLLLARQKAFHNEQVPYIQAAVFLSAAQCDIHFDKVAAQHIYLGPDAPQGKAHNIVGLILGKETEAEGREGISRAAERALGRAMEQLGLRKRTGRATVGDYELTGLINENDRYQDWRARHVRLERDLKRIRIFPYAQSAGANEKRERKDIATRAYELLRDIHHEGILAPRQLTESDTGPALVYDFDPDAQRLDHLLNVAATPPPIGERIDLVRNIAETLAYAHAHGVCHRALSPWTIELQRDPTGQRRAVLRDWQSGIAEQYTRIDSRMTLHVSELAGMIDNPQAAIYAAPEVIAGEGHDAIAIDVYALGALTYALLSGRHPAQDLEEMAEKCRRGPGLLLSEVLDGTPDSLQELIQFATDPKPSNRPASVREFLALLDNVEDDLTTPEPERGVRPADAHQGDKLTGGFAIVRRLGAGSTCHAFAVRDASDQKGVLKVAKEAPFNARLETEYETLKGLHHPNIVKAFSIHDIDGLTGIFIEQAGEETLGKRLREQGALSLDLLERFGDDLLGVLVHLEREGVNHRDIKPENIGLGETRKRALTLKLFDFSLSRAPLKNIRAGTPPYLDPFLSLREPARWDLHAERFAAAMTLYAMATGTLPTWGEAGQDPASASDEAALDVERFDASIRDDLASFFRRALKRNAKQRFDNADDMHLAWKNLFRHIDQTTLGHDTDDTTTLDFSHVKDLSATTPLATLGLSARVLNAADRVGAASVGDLLALPGIRFYRNRGIGQRITRRLREVRDLLADRLDQPAVEDVPDEASGSWSIDRLVRALSGIKLDTDEHAIIEHWLGLVGEDAYVTPDLPSQRDVAEATGNPRASVQTAIDKATRKWSKNAWMTTLRSELAEFLRQREFTITLPELTAHYLNQHGSTAQGLRRQQLACAVAQAALEGEAALESARFVLYRGHSVPLIIATAELDPRLHAGPAERAAFAKRLAERAQALAHEDTLPSPDRVRDELAGVKQAQGDPPITPKRRLRLAVAAASGVALSSRQEIYPADLPAERALRLGANALLGARRLGVKQLQMRIHSRFPSAKPLPDRPQLDALLQAIDFPLTWQEAEEGQPAGYAIQSAGSGLTGATSTLRRLTTAMHTSLDDTPGASEAEHFDATVQRALKSGRVLLVTADLARVERAADELVHQFDLTRVSIDHLLLDALKSQAQQVRADWNVVLHADAAAHASTDWRRLTTLVARAMPGITDYLRDHAEPLLIQHLGLLVRYGQVDLIQTLRDAARGGKRPARMLLLPGDSHQPPVLDGHVLPIITPADWTHLPKSWLENRHRAAPAAPASGTHA